jgi:lipid A 4'-phosphatase
VKRLLVFLALFAVVLALPVIWPQSDLIISAWFYREGQGFFLADNPVLVMLHWLAFYGARVLGIAFVLLVLRAVYSKWGQPNFSDAKPWLFLLLALLIGPGLIANVGLKDHWGRARPREVVEFNGAARFSPALMPQFKNAHSNGSFVSGDGAFGFFLPAFAYVAPRRTSRRVFWGGMAAGAAFGFTRLAMGAHFFSDIVYAAFLMLAATAGVHAAMYGWRETVAWWKTWFGEK